MTYGRPVGNRKRRRLLTGPVLLLAAMLPVFQDHAMGASVMRSAKPAARAPGGVGHTADADLGRIVSSKADCRRYESKDPTIYLTDFRWDLAPEQFKKFGKVLYFSNKRLADRFYVGESGTIKAPVVYGAQEADIVVPNGFVSVVRHHLAEAFRLHIIDHLAMSDLGHAHIFVRHGQTAKSMNIRMDEFIAIERLIRREFYLLYHSAERLKMKIDRELSADPYAQLRFLTRNFVGYPDRRIRIVYDIKDRLVTNSVGKLGELRPTGKILYINANHRGCFVLPLGKTELRFDLSFSSPTGEPGADYED